MEYKKLENVKITKMMNGYAVHYRFDSTRPDKRGCNNERVACFTNLEMAIVFMMDLPFTDKKIEQPDFRNMAVICTENNKFVVSGGTLYHPVYESSWVFDEYQQAIAFIAEKQEQQK